MPGSSWEAGDPYKVAIATELGRLEHLIIRVWQILALSGVAVGTIYALAVAPAMGLACAGVSAGFLVWFVTLGFLVERVTLSGPLFVASTVIEALIPWLFTVVIVFSKGPEYALGSWVPPFLFCTCIVAHVARLRPFAPLVFGIIGGVVYPVLYFGVLQDRLSAIAKTSLLNQPATQITRSFVLFGAGLISTLLVIGLRHVIISAEVTVREREVFGKYRIGRELASGATGVVHEAVYHPEAGFERRVVVKRLPREVAEHPEIIEDYRRESEIAATLAHPNLLQLYDFGRFESDYYLVLEYVDGLSLAALKVSAFTLGEPLESELVAHIGHETLLALDTAHRAGTVHRDLCPDHVLLSRAGGVKLSGLFLARAIREMNRLRPGHAQYAAPEQVSATSDPRSDLYSLGTILWELFTGRPRVYEESTRVTPFRPDLHQAWDVFFESALANDPAYRAQSARDLLIMIVPLAGGDSDHSAALLAARVARAFAAAV